MKPFKFVITFDLGAPTDSTSNTLKALLTAALADTPVVKVSSVAISRYGEVCAVTLDCEGDTESYPFSPVVTTCFDALKGKHTYTKLLAHSRL